MIGDRTDFRDGKTFPRRGREGLGDFLWLPRVIDKARAHAKQTQDGYIYPCPMDRAMMQRWGVTPREFTAAIAENPTDDQMLAWLSERVMPDRRRTANEWLLRQKSSLDRHDAEEGVPGAIAPKWPPKGSTFGIVIALVVVLVSVLLRVLRGN